MLTLKKTVIFQTNPVTPPSKPPFLLLTPLAVSVSLNIYLDIIIFYDVNFKKMSAHVFSLVLITTSVVGEDLYCMCSLWFYSWATVLLIKGTVSQYFLFHFFSNQFLIFPC